MLPKYSKKDIKKAEKIIYSYVIKDCNSSGKLGSANGCEMPKDLNAAILYESSYDNCIWGEGNWTNLSGNGCKFSSCDFFTNKINGASLQHSLFDSAVFYNCTLKGSNFSYCTFTKTIMKKCPVKHCAFTGAVFNHVTFDDAIIKHSNFELCKFQNSTFKNIDLSNLALKYAFFHNVKMEKVDLPLMQIPYVFGGMRYVFSTKDKIRIATTNKSHQFISVSEYQKLLPQLITFFSGHNDYFPLANCYLVNDQYQMAIEANKTGIEKSALGRDFRKLYFFCIQAAQELDISKTERHKLYNDIVRILKNIELNSAEYKEFQHYFPMIKRLMLDNPHNSPTLLLSFHTNIKSDDYENLGILMRTLDELAEEYNIQLDSKHMEIRHNSPNIIDWIPVGSIEQLLQLLQNTWDTVYPILSTVVQESANVTTIVTGLYGLHKIRYAKKQNREIKAKEITKNEKQLERFSNHTDQNITDDQIETLKLRIQLLKQEQESNKDKSSDFSISIPQSETIRCKLQEKISMLKSKGICIEILEIQILDDQNDVLEELYNSHIELV